VAEAEFELEFPDGVEKYKTRCMKCGKEVEIDRDSPMPYGYPACDDCAVPLIPYEVVNK